MNERVLLVDDDPNILAAYKRQFRKLFDIDIADSGEKGLEAVETNEPFAVIVADMRMPGMDGVQLLTKVKELAPDTVRMMLTGNADQQTAVDAVNEGSIFRFLTKPCPPEVFTNAIRAGLEQYRLITVEKELLENTLSGSVKVLVDVLSLVNPEAFSRASRIKRYIEHIADALELPNKWQYALAGSLSQIGCVTLPPEVLEKVYTHSTLSEKEQNMYLSHPSVGKQLIGNIPRLELVSQIIANQRQEYVSEDKLVVDTPEYTVALGSQMLKLAVDFDELLAYGLSYREAFSRLLEREAEYSSDMIAALQTLPQDETDKNVEKAEVKVKDLKVGMIINQDICAENGLLLINRGQVATLPIIFRLKNFSQSIGVDEPFDVLIVK